jgi:hypothetical protein
MSTESRQWIQKIEIKRQRDYWKREYDKLLISYRCLWVFAFVVLLFACWKK